MGLFNRQHEAEKNRDHANWVKAQNAARDAGKRHGFGSKQHKVADNAAKQAAQKAQRSANKFWGK